MGCMCAECKFATILRDNHDEFHFICTCIGSDHFLKEISFAFDNCDYGMVDDDDESEEGGDTDE